MVCTKGQLISKCHFRVFNPYIKRAHPIQGKQGGIFKKFLNQSDLINEQGGIFFANLISNPIQKFLHHFPIRDGDISWTMTSRGHYFSKWATSRGHSQRVTFRGHFW